MAHVRRLGGHHDHRGHRLDRRGAPIASLAAGREALVAALRARGVDWLAPTDARLEEPLADETLIGSLAAHPDPRLRQALTGLFLLQPQLWEAASRASEQLAGAARDELTARYMAAAYLQRFWHTRLRLYQGEVLLLPDLYSALLGLPPVAEGFGQPGLRALAEWQAARSAIVFKRLAEYTQAAEHVFARLEVEVHKREPALAG